jgi:hypothetical protein
MVSGETLKAAASHGIQLFSQDWPERARKVDRATYENAVRWWRAGGNLRNDAMNALEEEAGLSRPLPQAEPAPSSESQKVTLKPESTPRRS